jgi:hypothetical protein
MKIAYLLMIVMILTGCVERTLYIKSEPAGARVILNHQELSGTTPLQHTFYHFGTYDVRLQKEGYEILEDEAKIKGPWYEHFPIDLLAQLYPKKIHIKRKLHYSLEERKVTPP